MTRMILAGLAAGFLAIPLPQAPPSGVTNVAPGWRACSATLQFAPPYPTSVRIASGRLTWRGADTIYLAGQVMAVPEWAGAGTSAVYPMPDLSASAGRADIALVLDGRDAESDLTFYLNGPGGMFGVWSVRNHWYVHWLEFQP